MPRPPSHGREARRQLRRAKKLRLAYPAPRSRATTEPLAEQPAKLPAKPPTFDAAHVDDEDDLLIGYLERKLAVGDDDRKRRKLLNSVAETEFGGNLQLINTLSKIERLQRRSAPSSNLADSGDDSDASSFSFSSIEDSDGGSAPHPDSIKESSSGSEDKSESNVNRASGSGGDLGSAIEDDSNPCSENCTGFGSDHDSVLSAEDGSESGSEDGSRNGSEDAESSAAHARKRVSDASTDRKSRAQDSVKPILRTGTLASIAAAERELKLLYDRVGDGNFGFVFAEAHQLLKRAITEESLAQLQDKAACASVLRAFCESAARPFAQLVQRNCSLVTLVPRALLLAALSVSVSNFIVAAALLQLLPLVDADLAQPHGGELAELGLQSAVLFAVFDAVAPAFCLGLFEHLLETRPAAMLRNDAELTHVLVRFLHEPLRKEIAQPYADFCAKVSLRLRAAQPSSAAEACEFRAKPDRTNDVLFERVVGLRTLINNSVLQGRSSASRRAQLPTSADCFACYFRGVLPDHSQRAAAASTVAPVALSTECAQLCAKLQLVSPAEQKFAAIVLVHDAPDAAARALCAAAAPRDLAAVLRVVLKCLLQQKRYSEYYSELVLRLGCSFFGAKPRHFQRALREAVFALRQEQLLSADHVRAQRNFARFLAFLRLHEPALLAKLEA